MDADEASRCSNYHGLHIHCRVELARRRIHKCPLCREFIEPDGGRNFCALFQIDFQDPAVRPQRVAASPTPSLQARRLRDRAIYLLQNRRFNTDVLQSVVSSLENV